MTRVAIAGRHIAKRYGHVDALTDASVEVAPGRVSAVFGDNGAGKSTLLLSLLGIVRPDSGEVVIEDEVVTSPSPRVTQALGVECVYQDLALAPDLSVTDNMFLGHEMVHPGIRGRIGTLARKRMCEQADEALRSLSIRLPSLSAPVRDLSGGQRQALAVARAVMWAHRAVLLDEPTAALGVEQSRQVAEMLRGVAAAGLGVLVVSHDLPRVLQIADDVMVLRRGATVHQGPANGLTVQDVVTMMVGYADDMR